MKKPLVIVVLFLLVSSFVSAQQSVDQLVGTWELTQFTYGDSPSTTPAQQGLKKFKLITPKHFSVIEVRAADNTTSTSIFGTYTLKDGIYVEKILHVNRESSGMIGSTFSFHITFDNEGRLIQTGSFNNIKTHEIWTKVSDDKADLSPDNKLVAISPRYIIEHDGKKVEWISQAGQKSPLTLLPQESIESLEVLKDPVAIEKQYGGSGANGLIIIKLKYGAWANIEKELEKNNNIKPL